jgi:flagellar motor switch protein FliM
LAQPTDHSAGRVEIFSRHRRALEDIQITPYDFRRPPQPAQGPIRSLFALHEAFAAESARTLSARLSEAVQINLRQVEQMTCSAFLEELANPTCLSVIGVEPLKTTFLIDLSPIIAYPLIDRLLGGSSGESFIPQRRMTQIERRLIGQLLATTTGVLSDIWRPVRALDLRFDRVESTPRAVQPVPPEDPVLVARFEVQTAGHCGPMSISMPWKAIAPIVEDLGGRPVLQSAGGFTVSASAQRMRGHVGAAQLELTAVLAETSITLEELRQLEVGDVIVTECAAGDPICLHATGRLRLPSVAGQHDGHRAVRLT